MTKLKKRLCCARTTAILGKVKRISIKKLLSHGAYKVLQKKKKLKFTTP